MNIHGKNCEGAVTRPPDEMDIVDWRLLVVLLPSLLYGSCVSVAKIIHLVMRFIQRTISATLGVWLLKPIRTKHVLRLRLKPEKLSAKRCSAAISKRLGRANWKELYPFQFEILFSTRLN